jgi:hypothetical protein
VFLLSGGRRWASRLEAITDTDCAGNWRQVGPGTAGNEKRRRRRFGDHRVANGVLALGTVARGVVNGMLVRSQLHLRGQEH